MQTVTLHLVPVATPEQVTAGWAGIAAADPLVDPASLTEPDCCA